MYLMLYILVFFSQLELATVALMPVDVTVLVRFHNIYNLTFFFSSTLYLRKLLLATVVIQTQISK